MARFLHVVAATVLLCLPALVCAQEDEVSLGDAARSVRKSRPPEEQKVEDQKVIDNDNFAIMMDKAESARLNGKPVFSIDPSGKTFRMTSPDGTCSLSFDAKATAVISTPYIASELPQDELLKLQGPAAIHDDILEISLHNGTGWELKEIVVGITELRSQPNTDLYSAKLMPITDQSADAKLPDSTLLYHLRATGAPDSITVFRGNLAGDFSDVKDWHWALVSARGIPPASPGTTAQEQATNAASPQTASPLPALTQQPPQATAPASKH